MTPHFSLAELIASETAEKHGIDNTPTPKALANLQRLAEGLEAVRAKLHNNPMGLSSGYRCLKLNRMVRSRNSSYHRKGLAADFTCPRFGTVPEIMKALADSDIEFDQLILEFNSWIHIGFAMDGRKPRRQKLVIDNSGVKVYN